MVVSVSDFMFTLRVCVRVLCISYNSQCEYKKGCISFPFPRSRFLPEINTPLFRTLYNFASLCLLFLSTPNSSFFLSLSLSLHTFFPRFSVHSPTPLHPTHSIHTAYIAKTSSTLSLCLPSVLIQPLTFPFVTIIYKNLTLVRNTTTMLFLRYLYYFLLSVVAMNFS